jgi:hypothetical protein
MPGRLSTQTRIAELRRIFRSDQKRLLDAYIARLCVLYEDLRIELFAISADSIPNLDVLDPATEFAEKKEIGKYRRYYFLRRSIGTLWEFAEGLRLLEGCPEFASVVPPSDVEIAGLWKAGADFFQSNEHLLKQVRNDIGGHFGSKAARYAVENLGSTATSKIEMIHHAQKPGRPEFRLNFAGELAASAFVRHLPGATVEEQVETFFQDVLVQGYRHATSSVHVLATLHLWPRFGHL